MAFAKPQRRRLALRSGPCFSSFSYLQRFSFDVLKLDRSLISKLESSARAQVVAATMQHLAERLEFKIIAEGVETLQELGSFEVLAAMERKATSSVAPLSSLTGTIFIRLSHVYFQS